MAINEEKFQELVEITIRNSENIQRLSESVEKMSKWMEQLVVHDTKLEALHRDREDIYSRLDEMQEKINRLITRAEKEIESLKGSTDYKIQQNRIKTLLWLLGAITSIASALALYTIKG